MGLLDAGTPMPWEEARQHAQHVRRNGIEQFINIYRLYEHETGTPMMWGDEIEYFVTLLDKDQRAARIPMRSPEILANLKQDQDHNTDIQDPHGSIYHPEVSKTCKQSIMPTL